MSLVALNDFSNRVIILPPIKKLDPLLVWVKLFRRRGDHIDRSDHLGCNLSSHFFFGGNRPVKGPLGPLQRLHVFKRAQHLPIKGALLQLLFIVKVFPEVVNVLMQVNSACEFFPRVLELGPECLATGLLVSNHSALPLSCAFLVESQLPHDGPLEVLVN